MDESLKKTIFLILSIGVLIVMLSKNRESRGIRNNNAGNIRLSNDAWQGLSDNQTDPSFFVFESPLWGIRAIAKILKSYRRRGIDTIAQIIATWAPDNENNTAAYIESVSKKTGIDKDEVLHERRYPEIIEAIIYHENGKQPYSAELIKEAVALS